MKREGKVNLSANAQVPMHPIEQVLEHAEANLEASLDRLFQLLRIPSVSCDATYETQCRDAASWLANELAGIGFDASVRSTVGNPIVVAHQKETSGPHVLFYGHYDVQPPEPIEEWNSEPFEPVLKRQSDSETHIVARGASDDKGQLLTFVEACRAWKTVTGRLPINVTMFFEGEEESGSPSMEAFLDEAAEELKADVMLLCDTYLWQDKVPAITGSFRGILEEEIEVSCASRDLHSGAYGNAARNPIQVLAELIASLRAVTGEVAIEGFYDDVQQLDVEEAVRLDFDQDNFFKKVGLSQSAGDTAYSVLEQIWARPSCEINGIVGGYYGEGLKTVIPSKALAKISFRLVAGQDPDKIRKLFREHIRVRAPTDCHVKFDGLGGSPAAVISSENQFLAGARKALRQEWNREPVMIGSGGSIPIVSVVKRRLGLESIPIGFARSDNRHHSPNEKYDLTSFQKGIRSWIRILAELSATAPNGC